MSWSRSRWYDQLPHNTQLWSHVISKVGAEAPTALTTIYHYNTTCRSFGRLAVATRVISDLDNSPSYVDPTNEELRGPVGSEEYERLLSELRRGASGDFSLPLPAPRHLRGF